MLRVFILFLITIAAIVAGPILAGNQGYVLIQTAQYNIETTITGLVIMLVILFGVLFILETLLRRILRTGARTRGWVIGRKSSKARKHTKAALLKMAEGDHRQMEKLLTRHADHAEQPVVNYLLAAEAAQQRGDEQRTQQYLARATELADNDQLPVEITRIRIQLAQNEDHAARNGIDRLLEQSPRHPEILRLAEQAYLRTGAYRALRDTLPSMAKAGIYDDNHLQQLQEQACLGEMSTVVAEKGYEGLQQWWKDQSRKLRQQTNLQVAMVKHLLACNAKQAAQELLVQGLKQHYDDKLVALIPKLHSGDPLTLEKMLNQLIKQQGATALLNSTLGQLQMQKGEWQLAKEAFNAALQQREDAYDYAWLADALDKLHQPQQAAEMRYKGLILTLQHSSDA
jgi:HemY protein